MSINDRKPLSRNDAYVHLQEWGREDLVEEFDYFSDKSLGFYIKTSLGFEPIILEECNPLNSRLDDLYDTLVKEVNNRGWHPEDVVLNQTLCGDEERGYFLITEITEHISFFDSLK